MNRETFKRLQNNICRLAAFILLTQAMFLHAAPGTLSDVPLYLGQGAEPNVLWVMDDSGSMAFEVLKSMSAESVYPEDRNENEPDYYINRHNVQVTPTDNTSLTALSDEELLNLTGNELLALTDDDLRRLLGLTVEEIRGITDNRWDGLDDAEVITLNDTDISGVLSKEGLLELCLGYNNLAYNSALTYSPWDYVNGSNVLVPMPEHNVSGGLTNVLVNPEGEYSFYTDLSEAMYVVWNDQGGGGDTTEPNGTYESGECGEPIGGGGTSVTLSGVSNVVRISDPVTGETEAERLARLRNYTNWYTYYRKRGYAMKAVLTGVFNDSDDRFGLASLKSHRADEDEIPGLEIADMSGASHKNAMVQALIDVPMDGGTPLRRALLNSGQYYDQESGTNPEVRFVGPDSTPDNPIEHSCQANYTVMVTDGYNNDHGNPIDLSYAYDEENANLTTANVDSNSIFGGGYYADNQGNTMGDLAMYYFSKDLDTTEENNFKSNNQLDTNPAQHMVTYALAFGVEGNINTSWAADADGVLQPRPIAEGWDVNNNQWPTSFDDETPESIDDLYHATFNSRGRFFNSSDPVTLRADVQAILDAIAEETEGTAAAVGVNSTSLSTDTLLYQGWFSSEDWSGELRAYQFGTSTVTPSTSSSSSGAVSSPCELPYSGAPVSISEQTLEWSSGEINISCATSVNISLTASGVGDMENADNLNISYLVDGATPVPLLDITNAYAENSLSVSDISGSTLEIVVNGVTSAADETYTVSSLSITSNGEVVSTSSSSSSSSSSTSSSSGQISFESDNFVLAWEASDVLGQRDLSNDPRVLFTWSSTEDTGGAASPSGEYGKGIAFATLPADLSNPDAVSGSLNTSHLADLLSHTSLGGLTTDAEQRTALGYLINWFKGDQSNEGIAFRSRARLLGDIVSSSPQYVGKPSERYPDQIESDTAADSYLGFVDDKSARTPMLYVGSNDGMLHGFNANTGDELFAYLPELLFSTGAGRGYHELAELNYSHVPYVDGTPTVKDVFINGWKTYLVGGLNGGGKGIYVLDVTDPDTLISASPAPTVAEVAESIAVGEFTHLNLGYTYARPQIGKMNDDRWAAIFGNGYNNDGSYEASLFVLYLDDLSPAYREISTGKGSDASPDCSVVGNTCNGLSSPSILDLNGDGKIDRVYAGDVFGNMWAFDVTGDNSNTTTEAWKIAHGSGNDEPLFTACRSAISIGNDCPVGDRQPITTKPVVVAHKTERSLATNPNLMVMFGTGQFLAEDDPDDTSSQSFYGVWDAGQSYGALQRGNLVAQQILENVATTNSDGDAITARSIDSDTVTYNELALTEGAGWYMDLPTNGERSVLTPLLLGEYVAFITSIPDTGVCTGGGAGWLMAANIFTGTGPSSQIFSELGDLAAGVPLENLSGGVISLEDKLIGADSVGNIDVYDYSLGGSRPGTRSSFKILK